MNKMQGTVRIMRPLLLVGLIALGSGCSWLRSNSDYEGSPESRPLSVPPDLDTPRVDPSMALPTPAAAAATPVASATPSAAFVVADTVESTWRRLGLALERIDGAQITQRAQALSAYNVNFGGEEFLLRVVAAGEQARIEAVGGTGAPINSGAAAELLGMLRARLG